MLEQAAKRIRPTWLDRTLVVWCAAYTATEETGRERSSDLQWCAAQANEQPNECVNLIPTACGRCVVLPCGFQKRVPTCSDCQRSLSGNDVKLITSEADLLRWMEEENA
jgi:hypothetical protein